jgi:zinc and cadmium transporter
MQLELLGYILAFTLVGSVLSIIGGVFLIWNKAIVQKISHLLISFAAGTLLGTAFLDLLPEGIEASNPETVFSFALIGFIGFFVMERFIHWMHHHHHTGDHEHEQHAEPTVALIMLGDSVHNFIDGVVIAASFLVSIPLGIVTALAVGTHEIPQEIGDFAVMLKKGLKPSRVLLFNFFSAVTAILGAVLMFTFGQRLESLLPVFLSITAGFFIYISASDLIPEIHEQNRRGFALFESTFIVLGILAVWTLVRVLD